MSTVAEIESEIEKLAPEDFRVLHEWIAKKAAETPGRMWTPEELGAAAERMVAEEDEEKSKEMWKEIVDGFYGRKSA